MAEKSKLPPFFSKMTSFFNPGKSKGLEDVALGKGEWIRQEFDKAEAYFQDDLDREDEAHKVYSGLEDGQWGEEAAATLKAQGRHIPQFNLVRGKIDALAGNFIKDFFDMTYLPVDSEFSPWTRVLEMMMRSDKESLDWEHSYNQAVKDGCIWRGAEQMVVSDRYSPLGNIGFERIMPGSILVDPCWKTNSGWDLKRLWKVAYLTPKEMKDIYGAKGPSIDAEVVRLLNSGSEFDQTDKQDGFPYKDYNYIYGTKRRVIEYHYMNEENQEIRYTVFGDVVPEGTDEYQREWASINGIEDFENMTYIIKKKVSVYNVITTVPDLNHLILEDKRSEIQIGRLPFFFWSSARINGRDSGIVELLIDAQQTINKRHSLIDDIISSNAHGNRLVDPDLFENRPDLMKEYKDNASKPGWIGFTAPGALDERKIYQNQNASFPSTEISELNNMIDMMDRMSTVTPAQSGRSEGSEESGILFARKQLQTEINQTPMIKNLEHYWNEKGEAYMLLAQQLYSGIYRKFSIGEDNQVIEINIPTPNGLQNDISMMPRHKVVVSQSPKGATQKMVDRAIYAELLRSIPAEVPQARLALIEMIFGTLTHNKEETDRLIELIKKDQNLQELRSQAEAAQLQAVVGQVTQPQQQLQAPQGAPTSPEAQIAQGIPAQL